MFRKSPLSVGALTLVLSTALLLCALLIPMGNAAKLILCCLSFLASFWPLALPLRQELTEKRRPPYSLLLALACILFLLAGRPCAGAAAMLLYRIAVPVLEWRREKDLRLIRRRQELAELGELLGDYPKAAGPSDDLGRFLQLWLPYLVSALAALVIILLMLLTRMNTALVLRRAAMVLALGSALPLFWAYGLCDYGAAVNACEQGAIFRDGSLEKLSGTKLCCLELPAAMEQGNAIIQSAMPEEVPPAALLELAACAWSCSPSHLGDTLAELLGHRTDPELLERYQELRDFGVLARIRGRVVICGSAEFMQRAGLPILPFKDRESTVHVGIEGRYAGCIRLNQTEPEEGELDALVRDCGLYRFADRAKAESGRSPEEPLLYASGDGDRGPAGPGDIYAALGGCGEAPEAATVPGGVRGAVLILKAMRNVKRSRALCFLPALCLKALLLLLSLFGLCPIWLTVLLEALAAWAGCLLAQQALNAKL